MIWRKILVLLTGKPVDATALSLACQQGKESGSRVYPVAVVEMRRTVPLDAADLPEMEEPKRWLGAAEAQSAAAGCSIRSVLLTARAAGPAVVDEIVERGVDLLVMGVAYEKRLDSFELDDTACYILKHAPCQVWLVRDAALVLRPTSR